MKAEIKSPALAGNGADNKKQTSGATLSRHETKLKRVLAELAKGTSLHRFQAERIGDHTLHSTVVKIQKYGIAIEREWIIVMGFAGHPTHVKKYWLNHENRERARTLLGGIDGESQRHAKLP
ncbi:MAG: hypothetical protein ACYC9J_00415 [Sulfuricaulis sp.]